MTGVEVLAAQEIAVAYAWNWTAYLITIVSGIVIMGIVGLFQRVSFKDIVIVSLISGVVLGGILGIFPAMRTKPSEYETQYKVIISDEVPMNDFLSKYEIISQEGRIYTVRNREEPND